MRKLMSLTDAVRQAATRGDSLTDAVKEAARAGVDGNADRKVARFPGSTLDGRHDGSQGGRHPWGPAPGFDGRWTRGPRFERKSDPQEPEPEQARAAGAGPQPVHSDPLVRLRRPSLADPALRFLASGVRLAGIAFLSFLSLVATPTVVGPDRAVVATPQKRVALVIGNSAYRHARKLENPRNDAADVSAALKNLGFQVIEGFDLDKAGLDAKVRAFTTFLKGADVGLFFYAGHGLHVSGQNFLVPVDAELSAASALELELVRLDLVHRAMERQTPTNLLFFDACLDMDVTAAASALDVPTLILHGREDKRIPFEQGVQLASRIRGSRLVPLDTSNHLLRPDEPAWAHFLREVDAFLAEDESTASPQLLHALSKDDAP